MYGILSYLRKVSELREGETEAELAKRKVLILCDCQPCLKAIEAVYRRGHTGGLHRKDRGAMLEAIARTRARLGEVVFLWNSSHTGATPSSYADLAAKTQQQAQQVEDVTRSVGAMVHTRPCIYERQLTGKEGAHAAKEEWGLADRKAYREGRLRARGHVRARLAAVLKPGATTAGETGALWTEVVKRSMRRPKVEDGTTSLKSIGQYNDRTSVVMGARSGNIPGMLHEKTWERVHRTEQAQGRAGPASRSRSWGCPLCRKQEYTRVALTMGQRREAKRVRQAWQDDARADYTEEERVCQQTSSCAAHVLSGACKGVDAGQACLLQRQVEAVHKESCRIDRKQGGGATVVQVLELARDAVTASAQGQPATEQEYAGLRRTVGGVLRQWEPTSSGKQVKSQDTTQLVSKVLAVQHTASEIIMKHIEESKPMLKFIQDREEHRALMTIVMRAWREEIEHSVEKVRQRPEQWRVRQEGDTDRKEGSEKRGAQHELECAAREADAKKKEAECAARKADIACKGSPTNNEHAKGHAKNIRENGTTKNGNQPGPRPRAGKLTQKQAVVLREQERLVSTCLSTLAGVRVNRPNQVEAAQQSARKRWNKLRAKLTQVVEKTSRARKRWRTLKAELTQVAEKVRTDNKGEHRPTRSNTERNYKETRQYQVKTRPQKDKKILKRRENTTVVTNIGMELYEWMEKIGDQHQANVALGWQKGIG